MEGAERAVPPARLEAFAEQTHDARKVLVVDRCTGSTSGSARLPSPQFKIIDLTPLSAGAGAENPDPWQRSGSSFEGDHSGGASMQVLFMDETVHKARFDR